MRIVDLHKDIEALVADGKYVVEFVGESDGWEGYVTKCFPDCGRRVIVTATSPTFLGILDEVAAAINADEENDG